MSAKALTHKLVSAVPDSAGAGVVKPSNWNADHDFLLGIEVQTGTSYTFADDDAWSVVTFNNAAAVAATLPQAASSGGTVFKSGWVSFVKNLGAGAVTITPTTSTINGAATYVLQQNEEAAIISDGTNYLALRCWALSQYANSFVRWDAAQSLSEAQQLQGRSNVYAAPLDALAFSGMQVNGSMEVSQENGASAVTLVSGGGITIADCNLLQYQHGSAVFTGQQVAPPGSPSFGAAFQSCVQMKSTTGGNVGSTASDIARFEHLIEGYRVARLGFGNAAASPFTVGFWVYATIAGTLSVSVNNSAANRSYITTVTVNNAATWEYKTVTIPGDTTGTWLYTTGRGLILNVASLCGSTFQGTAGAWGAGFFLSTSGTTNFFASNNNVLCITGLVVLPGSAAPSAARSPFIMRPFDEELWISQRYYQKTYEYGTAPGTAVATGAVASIATSTTIITGPFTYSREMRAVPATVTFYSFNGTSGVWSTVANADTAAVSINNAGSKGFTSLASSGLTAGALYFGHWTASARV